MPFKYGSISLTSGHKLPVKTAQTWSLEQMPLKIQLCPWGQVVSSINSLFNGWQWSGSAVGGFNKISNTAHPRTTKYLQNPSPPAFSNVMFDSSEMPRLQFNHPCPDDNRREWFYQKQYNQLFQKMPLLLPCNMYLIRFFKQNG